MIYHYTIRRSAEPYTEGMFGFMVDQGATRFVYVEADEEQSTLLSLKYKVQKLDSTLESMWDSWGVDRHKNPFRKSESDLPAETTNSNCDPT